MARLLLRSAAEYFQKKGDTGITYNFLAGGCRAGILPHMRIGNRYIVDTDQLEDHFKKIQEDSVRHQESPDVIQYGKLRKVPG